MGFDAFWDVVSLRQACFVLQLGLAVGWLTGLLRARPLPMSMQIPD